MRDRTAVLKQRAQNGESLDSLLPEAFAVVREASKRVIGLRPFDVQLMGGMVLHKGEIAEMRTGEGKTLVAILLAYLNALTGKGVHVVTIHDYLARQSLQICLQIVRFPLEKEYSLNSARLPSMSNNTEFEEAELEDEAEQLTRREERFRFWSDPDTKLKLAKNAGVGVFRMGVDWTRIMPNESSPKL